MTLSTVINKLTFANFRNLKGKSLGLGKGIHFISGSNGAGKTNLLDAVYYLCIGRSHFSYGDGSAIVHSDNWLRLVGEFSLGEQLEKIVLTIRPRRGKQLERNGAAYAGIIEHVGLLPAVMISPADIELVIGGPEERRRFLDQSIAQFDPAYLKALVTYNKLLKLRNALLKEAKHALEIDLTLLATYDSQLLQPAQKIHEARAAFVDQIRPLFAELYNEICGGKEEPAIHYKSKLSERPYEELLLQSRDHDTLLKRTNVGPHRDELALQLNGEGLRKFASQGQLKTFLLALRLGQARILRAKQGKVPILLLDDLFDRLDPSRVQHLIDLVQKEDYAQIFVTDTHPDRLLQLEVSSLPTHYYSVSAGEVTQIQSPNAESTI